MPRMLLAQLFAPTLLATIVPMIEVVPSLAIPEPSEPDPEPTLLPSIVSPFSVAVVPN